MTARIVLCLTAVVWLVGMLDAAEYDDRGAGDGLRLG
jgi:hypothetical protein